MELFVFAAISCLLVASTDAQGCSRITLGDLGASSAFSRSGLIAERLADMVRVEQFAIACEVTAGSQGLYSQVSVVVEYTTLGSTNITRAQLESTCGAGGTWNPIEQDGFTVPSEFGNVPFNRILPRRDCYQCVSPQSLGNSAPGNNHCLRKCTRGKGGRKGGGRLDCVFIIKSFEKSNAKFECLPT